METQHSGTTKFNERLTEALTTSNPTKAVMELVLETSRSGIPKKVLTDSLSARHTLTQKNEHKWQEEAVLGDILDMMTGFFVPNPENLEQIQFIEHFRTL